MEDGPSYRFNNRYNVAGKFGAIYLAGDVEVCRATLEKRGYLAGRMTPHVLLTYEVHCERILDLTDLKTMSVLNLRIEDFLKPSDQPGAYDAPQLFSSAVYDHGAIDGLLVPDVTHTGNTLVLYPGRVLTNGSVRLKERRTL